MGRVGSGLVAGVVRRMGAEAGGSKGKGSGGRKEEVGRNDRSEHLFPDYPTFLPNLSPEEVLTQPDATDLY